MIDKEKAPETMLKSKVICEWLDIDQSTLSRMVKNQKIPAYRIGSELRFKKHEVEKFIESNSTISNNI
jgi:excisionase family DNA binding protein